ncbi:MAG: ABC transporter substrate-binding protein [Natronomonas sp.]
MSRYQLTRRNALQLSGVGAAGIMAGCLGDDDSDGDGGGDSDGDSGGNGGDSEVHILTDYASEAWQEYWEDDLIAGWESDNPDVPINIEFRGFQGTGEQRLATLLQSGEPPELYHGTISEVGDLVNQGQTMAVNDVISELEDLWGGEMLFKNTANPFDDEIHLVPHGVYMGGTLNYRQDIYDELGLEVPETWGELVENARAIDEAEQFDERGFAVPAAPSGKSGSDFSNWLYNAGGDVWQFANNGGDEVELWFDEDHVIPALEHIQELAQYSPDPSSLDWGSTIEQWAAGRLGQTIMNNAWLAGPAYFAENEPVAFNTKQAVIPMREGADPLQRGWVLIDGTPILDESSNPEGAKDFLRYMYGEERHPEVSLMEPLRFIPPFQGVAETDAYQNADIFQVNDGIFLEKNQRALNEIAPTLDSEEYSGKETPSTPETLYAGTFPIDSEMVNQVIVEGRDIQTAYEEASERLEERLEEAVERANY